MEREEARLIKGADLPAEHKREEIKQREDRGCSRNQGQRTADENDPSSSLVISSPGMGAD
jgi:hypothetical protein